MEERIQEMKKSREEYLRYYKRSQRQSKILVCSSYCLMFVLSLAVWKWFCEGRYILAALETVLFFVNGWTVYRLAGSDAIERKLHDDLETLFERFFSEVDDASI